MNKVIMEKYYNLIDDLLTSYSKIKVVDDWNWTESHPYAIIYLNKNESFEKFEDLWNSTIDHELDYCDNLANFEQLADEQFDYLEISLDTFTDSEYELKIN